MYRQSACRRGWRRRDAVDPSATAKHSADTPDVTHAALSCISVHAVPTDEQQRARDRRESKPRGLRKLGERRRLDEGGACRCERDARVRRQVAGPVTGPPRCDDRRAPRGKAAPRRARDAGRGGGKFVLEGAAAVHDPGPPARVDRGRRGAAGREREGVGTLPGGSRRAVGGATDPARPRG